MSDEVGRIGHLAEIACVLEATARKPGNVHRFADFEDCTYLDFVLSASAIAGPMDRAVGRGVGATVREAVEATRRVVATNTNLGMVLLLAPLAAMPPGRTLRDGIGDVLEALTVEDAREVFAAIRRARPGGLGAAAEQDVAGEPTVTLRAAMALAADRDLVARQYAHGFVDVFAAEDRLRAALGGGAGLERAIVAAFVGALLDRPDTLIARKRGAAEAAEVSRRLRDLVDRGEPLDALDAWLRADGQARNPGATADLIAAALFVALRDGGLPLPLPRWSDDEHPWRDRKPC